MGAVMGGIIMFSIAWLLIGMVAEFAIEFKVWKPWRW